MDSNLRNDQEFQSGYDGSRISPHPSNIAGHQKRNFDAQQRQQQNSQPITPGYSGSNVGPSVELTQDDWLAIIAVVTMGAVTFLPAFGVGALVNAATPNLGWLIMLTGAATWVGAIYGFVLLSRKIVTTETGQRVGIAIGAISVFGGGFLTGTWAWSTFVIALVVTTLLGIAIVWWAEKFPG